MTPWRLSVLAWLGGGVLGAVVAKDINPKLSTTTNRVLGFLLGAVVIGAISDKFIERYHPGYTGFPRVLR